MIIADDEGDAYWSQEELTWILEHTIGVSGVLLDA